MTHDNKSKIHLFIEREQLTSVMNNTKWERLISQIWQGIDGFYFEHRQKSIFSTDYITPWDGEFYYHLRPFNEVEWVDIRASNSENETATAKLKKLLVDCKIPFSIEGSGIRVWGYLRLGCSPDWVLEV